MKGGLCIVYTSLLTILVLSSCALFILVVSEALQVEPGLGEAIDPTGLRNVSQKVFPVNKKNVPPDFDSADSPIDASKSADTKEFLKNNEMTFTETLSLNSVTTDGLPDTGQPPILISLADNAKLDVTAAEDLLYGNDSEQHNDTKTFTVVDSSEQLEEEKLKPPEAIEHETLIFKAKPMHEVRQTENAFVTTPDPILTPDAESAVVESQVESEQLIETTENIPLNPQTPQEDIPSFSEWAQKQLAEAEKKDTVLNHSTQPSHSNTNFSSKSTKIRSKNYASPACGAKIVAKNSEARSASSILSTNRDEYMLNTCDSRIWFIVELCEAVQAQKIEIANFELFSSTPKDIAVYFSDRFPTRDWASVGQFTAKDKRDVQSFDLYPHMFGKFIKVEMLSHHGSEHYCPISLFRVYGTSEFEVLEKESSQHAAIIDDDDDDEIIDVPDITAAESETSKNLFGSARDAVMSIMKKAAQVLVKSEVPRNVSSEQNDTSTDKVYKQCCSPSHIIVCNNCSEALYNEVYELISCSSDKLTTLVQQVFLRDTLKCTGICQPYGLDFKSTKTIEFSEERVAYMSALFPPKYLAALCNILAIKEKKVVLNTSFETELNVTTNITENIHTDSNDEVILERENKILLPIDNGTSDDNKTKDPSDSDAKPPNPEISSDLNPSLEDAESKDFQTDDRKEPLTISDAKQNLEKTDTEYTNIPIPDNMPVDLQNLDHEIKDTTSKVEIATETIKDSTTNVGDETSEQILIENDSFLTEFDQLTADPTPAGLHPSQQNPNQPQTLQKESVFLRLSNRVKTLERNMSLSAQYLEELSRRYKKQVEEMQKTFEKTILQMTEERRKSNEREHRYLKQMSSLQEQIGEMAVALKILMEERDSWFGNITFTKFVTLEVLIVGVIAYYIMKRPKEPIMVPIPKKVKKKDKFRRKSVEGVSGHGTPSVKQRRPSEEALRIARQSVEEPDEGGEWQIARKNRRRKTSIIHRNLENNNWGRQDSMGKLEENPIPLDEEEFVATVSEPKQFEDITTNGSKKEFPKVNGSIFNNLKAKTMKTRRLSSPAFLRTFSRQSSRSTPSPVVRNLESIYNGKLETKAASESPTGSLWSESTETSQVNGFDDTSKVKKKKGLKNIFKKVF